jgi:hypothetical protein
VVKLAGVLADVLCLARVVALAPLPVPPWRSGGRDDVLSEVTAVGSRARGGRATDSSHPQGNAYTAAG